MEELEKMFELFPEKECPNINSAFRKLHANLMFRSERAAVSISGGSDSDVMLDMFQALNPAKNYPFAEIHYVWFNTGIEYTATKEHLDFLQEKYGVTIERKKAKTPVPLGCKTWGQPFMSKQISQYISRLQAHGFQWEDEPFEVLYSRYPNCKAALRWWCNAFGPGSRMNIEKCRLLKEFMVANPPKISFSDGCCKGAKKDVAHDYMDYVHLAWDNPEEDLTEDFRRFGELYRRKARQAKTVYVLTNYNSTLEQDLHRIYTLRDLQFGPFVMVYDRENAAQVYKDLQRYVNNRRIFYTIDRFEDYDREKGRG